MVAERELSVCAGQVLVAGFGGIEAPSELLGACARGELGGIILFKRNLSDVHDIPRLISKFVEATPPALPLLVAVDQEGGRVARLGPPVLQLPPMRKLAALDDPALTEACGRVLGRQLRALGFSMNLAPVLDVDTNPQNPVIGDRSFGSTPDAVVRHALAFARGLGSHGGVLACGKHFPGHGDTDLDSHLALPRLPHPRQRLDAVELPPFRAARGVLPALMTAHVVFDSVEPGVPATLSSAAVSGLLRRELGFDGVVISDDLEMKAISAHFGVPQAAVSAVAAGVDTLLVCSDTSAVFAAQAALVARAEADPAFRARLEDAADRSQRMRADCVPTPLCDAAALDAVLASPEAMALATTLRERLRDTA
jgi:beta-N-acetylhexosaminidase